MQRLGALTVVAISLGCSSRPDATASGYGSKPMVAQAVPSPPISPPKLTALFTNVTRVVGLQGIRGERIAFADLNGDGFADLVVDKTQFFHNVAAVSGSLPRRRFVRMEQDKVFRPQEQRGYMLIQFGDVNNDGHLDLFLGRNTDLADKNFKDDGLRSEIWLGDGKGNFTRKNNAGVETPAESTMAACFVDYDRDGILDLVIGNSYISGTDQAYPSRLLRGQGDGTFVDVTEPAGLLGVPEKGLPNSRRSTYGVGHTDWNNDGWPDLLFLTYGREANRLWRNNGNGTFTDVAERTTFDGDADRSGTYPAEVRQLFKLQRGIDLRDEPPWRSHGNTFDAAVGDFNGDGYMDLFLGEIAHWWAGPSSDRSMLLVNLGPKQGYRFQREPQRIQRPHATPEWNEGDITVSWADIDNDGYLDLLIASSNYPDEQILRLYHQRKDGTFEDWTDRLGFKWVHAAQMSLADFDQDGALDIVLTTNTVNMPPERAAKHDLSIGLFRNLAPAALGNGFLSLRLVGGGPGQANRSAIGARVTIWIGQQRQTREVFGGVGHAGHRDDSACHFGVGKAIQIDRLEVRWPDQKQTVQVFTNVPTSKFYTLKQGGTLEVRH